VEKEAFQKYLTNPELIFDLGTGNGRALPYLLESYNCKIVAIDYEYKMLKLARKKVTVVLTGDGSDEIFAGYSTYQADRLARYYRKIPSCLQSLIESGTRAIPASHEKMSWESKLKRFVRGAKFSPGKAHHEWRTIFHDDEKKNLIHPDWLSAFAHADSSEIYDNYFASAPTSRDLEKSLYSDLKVFLAGSILPKMDLMTMANSLESRAPFLDHELVEILASTPLRWKMKGFQSKYLLKKLMKGKLPEEIIWRKKAGFNLPLGKWLREDLSNFILEILNPENVHALGFLNWNFVRQLLAEHRQGLQNHDYKLWGLMNLVRWHQKFVHGKI
jgi:asparagine synthase (glutamine-hydrolysing)